MWDTLLGEMGLPAPAVRALSWDEVDSYLNGYQVRRQKELAGFRLIAVQVYNALAEKPLEPEQYLPLALIDQPKPAGPVLVGGETAEQFRNRLAAKNQETLAARAALATP